jgi:hypothetical protein
MAKSPQDFLDEARGRFPVALDTFERARRSFAEALRAR